EDDSAEGLVALPENSSGAVLKAIYEGDKPSVAPGTNADTAAGHDDATTASKSPAVAREGGPGTTDVEMITTGGIAAKRAFETPDSTGKVGTSGTGEPPTRTAIGQRPTFKQRPNLPPNR
ncbi:hypothetical protein MRX96_038116, partial [Rhipicephalus microplus]